MSSLPGKPGYYMSKFAMVCSFQPRQPELASRHAVENAPKPVFVGRDKELSQLTCIMERVLLGHGHVFFVTGEAGIGKTALLREFSWRSLERNKALLVILGSCNAQPDIAGAYLPFLEAFHMLTGDIQPQWINGAISKEHVRRLRVIAPEVIKVILEVSPALLSNLVSASELAAFSRMDKDRHTLLQLDHLSDPAYKKGQVSQAGLFEQILARFAASGAGSSNPACSGRSAMD